MPEAYPAEPPARARFRDIAVACSAPAASVAVRVTARKYRSSASSSRMPIRLLLINAH